MNESMPTQRDSQQMLNVAGVQFRRSGKIYQFDVGGLQVIIGDPVVVDTDRGPSIATVKTLAYVEARGNGGDPKKILRIATERDLDSGGRQSPLDAVRLAREKVERLKIDMRVLKVESQFGGQKVVVYFSAPGRVDFRELVKDLAGAFKSRVELKQVGARDETKLLGGIGVCGREYCCSSFLRDFVPVSIRMAKMQNLALNPTKVSGGCGRLLCCLTYENDLYRDLRKTLPGLGVRIRNLTTGEEGVVARADILNQTVGYTTEDGRMVTCKVHETEIVGKTPQRQASAADGPTDEAGSSTEDWGEDIDLETLESEGTTDKE